MPPTESTETTETNSGTGTTTETSETTGTDTAETAATETDTTGTETTTTETTTDTTNTTTETATETTETTTEPTTETTESESAGPTTGTADTAEPDAESDDDAELIAFVGQSSTRTAVLERLVTGPASADDVATRDPPDVEGMRGVTGDLRVGTTRSTIEALRDKELVELLIDDDPRIYSLTAKGERILFAIQQEDG